MKTNIFEFKINEDKKTMIARKLSKSIKMSETNLINLVIEHFEMHCCKIIHAYVIKELDVYQEKKPSNISLRSFLNEIDEIKKDKI